VKAPFFHYMVIIHYRNAIIFAVAKREIQKIKKIVDKKTISNFLVYNFFF